MRPALVRQCDHRNAALGVGLAKARIERFGRDHQPRRDARRRETVVTSRYAARNLQIHEAVSDPIAGDDLAQDAPQRRLANRRGDPQGLERRLEPREMPGLVNQRPVAHLADFIDAVAELKARSTIDTLAWASGR